MLFESLALASVGKVFYKGIGANALKQIARTTEKTGLLAAEDMFKGFRFVRNNVAPFAEVAYRAGTGGAAGYAIGTGVDWYTHDNQWARRLGTIGLIGGAGLGVSRGAKTMGGIISNAFHKTSVARGEATKAKTISDVVMRDGKLHGIRRTWATGMQQRIIDRGTVRGPGWTMRFINQLDHINDVVRRSERLNSLRNISRLNKHVKYVRWM